MFDVQIHQTIATIPPGHWHQINQNRPFSSRRWYQFLEKTFAPDQPIYIILYQSAEPVALAIFWVKADEPLPISSSIARSLTAAAIRRWPLIQCQDPLVGGSPCLLLPGNPELQTAALKTISEHAQIQLRNRRGSFLTFTYLDQAQCQWPGWPNNFAVMDIGEPQTILPLQWSCYDDYLTWLRRSKKSTYKDYRRHCNRAASLGIEVTIHDRVTAVDEALTLVHTTHNHHGSMLHPNIRPTMENLPMVGGHWLAARQNGRLVGTGLLLNDNGGWIMAFLGLDYNVRFAYFQLLYTALRKAINSGGIYLLGGASSYEPKERLGFQKQTNSYVGFISHSRVLSWIGRRLSDQAV